MPVLRWCGWPVRAGRQARGRADPAFVGTGVLVMAAARPWRRVAEGRDRYLVGFGELKGVLQGAPGSFRAAEHLERDHAQQERRCDPDPSGPQAVEERGGRGRRRMASLAGGRLGRMPRICRLAPWPPGRAGCLPFGCAAEGQSLIIAVMSSPRPHMACCWTGSGRRDTRGRRRRAERRTGSGRKGRRRRGPPLLVNRAREAPRWPGSAASQSAGNCGSSARPPASEVPRLTTGRMQPPAASGWRSAGWAPAAGGLPWRSAGHGRVTGAGVAVTGRVLPAEYYVLFKSDLSHYVPSRFRDSGVLY